MRGPFLLTHPSEQELTENSRNPVSQELTESGWFNEGLGPLLTVLGCSESTGPARDP